MNGEVDGLTEATSNLGSFTSDSPTAARFDSCAEQEWFKRASIAIPKRQTIKTGFLIVPRYVFSLDPIRHTFLKMVRL